MRVTTLLLLTGFLHVSASGITQGISLSEKNEKLETIFNKIFQQTGYEFFYNSETLQKSKTVTVDVRNETINHVLDICFKDQPLSYEIVDKTIIVKEKPSAKPALVNLSGVVTDENDEPLDGATVRAVESDKIAITDKNGEFRLTGVHENETLQISSIGFSNQQIKVDGLLRLSIKLKLSVKGLDETIIIAYGKSSKRYYLGSVSKVDNETIQQQPVNNVLEALEGRIPGLSIQQTTGLPGGNINVKIRGRNSIASGNTPFFIVDGIPFLSTSLSSAISLNIIGGANPLNMINPEDIESIEVLKDAEATSIYGSRGANGVILITTKRPKFGKTNIQVKSNIDFGKISHQMKLLNTHEYVQMRKEAFSNDGLPIDPNVIDAPDLFNWDTTRSTDWQKKLLGSTAKTSNVELSLNGGDINTQFLVSGNYRKTTTVFPGDYSDQIASTRISLFHSSVNKKFKSNFNVAYSGEKNNLFSRDITGIALTLPPDAPDFLDNQGNLLWTSGTNPYSYLKQKFRANTENLMISAALSYEIIRGFTARLNAGYTKMLRKEILVNPLSSLDPDYGYTAKDTYTDFANNTFKTWITEPQLEWRKKLSSGELDVLAGATFQEDIRDDQTLEGKGYSNESLMEDIQSASSISSLSSNYYNYKYNGFFGRVTYNWKEKYFMSISGRRDGSSRFGPDKRFSNFGSIGAGWIFTEEKGIKERLSFLSYGKLKGSYGVSGNDQILDYQFLELWIPAPRPYGNATALFPSRIANPDYSWERIKKMELSLETGFIKDRILISVNYFRNRSDNQLVSYSLPASTGFTYIQDNLPAVVQNTGWEFELTSSNIKNAFFSWNSSINITIPRNKLVSYPGIENSSYQNTYVPGKSLGIYKSFHYLGVNSETGLYEFQDVNKNGSSYDFPDDLQAIKTIGQRYYGGIQNSFQYKNWQLSIFIQFVKQTGKNYLNIFNTPGFAVNQPRDVLKRWQKPGDETSVQKFTSSGSDAFLAYAYGQALSDFIISDASFARLKNVYLSYSFSQKTLKKLKIQRSLLFVSGQNLYTLTNYKGPDPETQIQTQPTLTVLSAGFQITF